MTDKTTDLMSETTTDGYGELPEGWRLSVLNELGHWTTGGTPSRKVLKYFQGHIPWIKSGDLNDSIVSQVGEYISEEAIANSAAKMIPRGALTIALYGATIGKLGILGVDAATNQACASCQFNPDIVNTRFVFYYLLEQRQKLIAAGQGGAQPNLTNKIVRDWTMPLAEQRRIVEKVDELLTQVNAVRARLARLPAMLKRFRQSVLSAACSGKLTEEWREVNNHGHLSWESMNVGTLIDRIEAGINIQCTERPPELYERGLVKISAVTWGTFDDKESKTLPQAYQVSERTKIQVGDFLISRANTVELVGACVLVHKVDRPVYLSDKVLRLVMPDTYKKWLLYYLRSQIGRTQIENLATGNQLSMRNLSQVKLRSITVELPPEVERNEIVRRVEVLFALADKIEGRVAAATERAEKLTQAILAKAFRGQLVPTEAELGRLQHEPPAQPEEVPTSSATKRSTAGRRGKKAQLKLFE